MTEKGMVVTPQPEATEAGRDILAAGGNAIDAAIATALVQAVVDPLMCGFALKGKVNDIGYQSVCVPASLKAYAEAHRDHGKLAWAELFGPAIAYAEGGWNVRPHVHTFWTEEGMMGRVGNAERIGFTPAARELYCRPDGSPK